MKKSESRFGFAGISFVFGDDWSSRWSISFSCNFQHSGRVLQILPAKPLLSTAGGHMKSCFNPERFSFRRVSLSTLAA